MANQSDDFINPGTLEQQLQEIRMLRESTVTDGLITERDMQAICNLANWQLTWPPDYFKTERTDVDIFYDILVPERKGFVLDWRYSPQEILQGIKSLTSELDDIIVTKCTPTVKRIKPFNSTLVHHYDIELSVNGEHLFGSFLPEEPDYFIFTLLRLANTNVQVVRADFNEDANCYICFAGSVDLRALADYLPLLSLTSTSQFVPVEEPARAKYFYIPVFTAHPKEDPTDNSKSYIDVMAFGTPSYRSPTGFASRVLPGQTLHDAIQSDLKRDFRYSGEFHILDYYLYDTGTDKQGNELPRLIVHIAVDKFATDGLKPAGMGTYWVRKNMAYLYERYKLGFGLEQTPDL